MTTIRNWGFSALMLASSISHALTIDNTQRQVPWPNGQIPFLIDDRADGTAALEANLRNAIAEWNAVGASGNLFQFFEITPAQVAQYPEHLDISLLNNNVWTECGAKVSSARGNAAGVGKSSGFPGTGIRSTMYLYAQGCGPRTPAHELGHVLGFLHEHQRPDGNVVIYPCNHAAANDGTTDEECSNTVVDLWALNIKSFSAMRVLNQYDPLSVMHYSLQNNLDPDLKGLTNPATGHYYTTLDFNTDAKKDNTAEDIAARYGMSNVSQLYAQMETPPQLLSSGDRSASRALYAKNSTDVHVSLSKTCFTKSTPSDACPNVGDFKVALSVKNYGAWPATNVALTLGLDPNLIPASLQLDSDENCNINIGTLQMNCELATVAPNGAIDIVLSGKVSDPGKASTLVANVTPPATQNSLLLDDKQYTSSVKFGGSLGVLSSLLLLVLGLRRRSKV